MSSQHLDIGYTGPARNVCDLYFDSFFPKAFNTSAELDARGGEERYTWTEFPWLIAEFLDGASGCAHRLRTPAEVASMEHAIEKHWVQWHANALNNFLELESEELFSFSLTMRETLNARFNKSHGQTCGKHTDVPGMSVSALPMLAEHGG